MARENKSREPGNSDTPVTRLPSQLRSKNIGSQTQSKSVQIGVTGSAENSTPENIHPVGAGASAENDNDTRLEQLERELSATRGELQAALERFNVSNEDFNAANEEVRIINEELQSTNEELKTSQEELQLLNEKLMRLNSQLAAKVK